MNIFIATITILCVVLICIIGMLFAYFKWEASGPPTPTCFGTDARLDFEFYQANGCCNCYWEGPCEQIYRFEVDKEFYNN